MHYTVAMQKHSTAKAHHFTVDFNVETDRLPKCSCEQWGQKGAPCEHGIVCLKAKGILDNSDPLVFLSEAYFHRITLALVSDVAAGNHIDL